MRRVLNQRLAHKQIDEEESDAVQEYVMYETNGKEEGFALGSIIPYFHPWVRRTSGSLSGHDQHEAWLGCQLTQSTNPSTGLGNFQIYRQVGILTQRHEYVTKAGVGGVSRWGCCCWMGKGHYAKALVDHLADGEYVNVVRWLLFLRSSDSDVEKASHDPMRPANGADRSLILPRRACSNHLFLM